MLGEIVVSVRAYMEFAYSISMQLKALEAKWNLRNRGDPKLRNRTNESLSVIFNP